MRALLCTAILAACALAAPAHAMEELDGNIYLAVDRYVLTPNGQEPLDIQQPPVVRVETAYSLWETPREPIALIVAQDFSDDSRLSYGLVSMPYSSLMGRHYPHNGTALVMGEKLVIGIHFEWPLSHTYRLWWS